jgi:hypothetical protein
MKAWSLEDERVLRVLWGRVRAPRIAEYLNRSPNSIIGKADRLGLPRISRRQKTLWLKEGYHQSPWASEHCSIGAPESETTQLDIEAILRAAA